VSEERATVTANGRDECTGIGECSLAVLYLHLTDVLLVVMNGAVLQHDEDIVGELLGNGPLHALVLP
jgi:hypothetical protein